MSEPRRWRLYDTSEDYHPLWTVSQPAEAPALEYAEMVEVMPVSEHEAKCAEISKLANGLAKDLRHYAVRDTVAAWDHHLAENRGQDRS